ncbi:MULTISPECIES: methylated-DNA--[protein]-cysteine S-methyltransferase [unclassified Sporosarcina]|uniref:methylated-DNA--[protein]-cysteine S-methyltransferase n=1 Tax=unclassified Sporosarcina TaxID=2647733 RepID=UPI0009C0489E|nr:hypothetical protein SporoP33_06130 [Sporosarcina sp. P33]PID17449.1 methylated-DNA--[protein]-cysteine S-methyltransferase [Sporosarcina sp. P35]
MIYWNSFDIEHGLVALAATEKGVCYIGLGEGSEERMKNWLSRQFGEAAVMQDADRLSDAAAEISKYLSGEIRQFVSPFDSIGTSFQLAVWEVLRDIPYGETAAYSDIAESIGRPAAVRAVASAIGKNPLLLIVPCHRVIGKNGSLSGYRDGLQWKERLLCLEKEFAGLC